MYNLFAISVVFILVHISCGLCFGYDARSNSLAGGEFFPYNVASFSDYKEKIFQIDMRRLYVGISDNTEIGLDCILPSRKTGSFVFKGSFVSDGALTQYEISAGYAKGKKFLGQFYFSFGGNFKIAGLGYDKSKFHNVDLQDPLFRGDLKKADFGLDLGFMLKYKSIETGFTVINVRSPSLSLVGSPEGKLLKEYLLNISFPLSHRLTVLSTYEHPEQLSPLYGLGLEYILFSDYLLRLGIRMEKNRFNQLSVGFGIPLKRFNFDYGFNYPITDALSRTATSTHNLSISYKLPLPPPLPDIALHSLILKDKQVVEGETLRYSFVVSNEGQERASEFPVVVWLEPDSSSFNTNYIVDGGLGINEERSFSGWFIVQSPGWYHIMVLADPSGLIREKKKNNNLIADTLLVSSEIQGKLELAFEKLELEELTYLVEEQPIIPVVFFDKDKSDINARFESMLQTIASRMKINKNIRLKLFGYVDTLSDSPNWKEKNLHIMRASKVSEFLAGLGVEPSRIEVVEQDYLPYAIRAGKRFESIPETQKPLINEENRRVEIVATLQGFDDTLKIYKGAFPQNETIERYKRFLAENPDIILIIKGYGSEDAPYEKLSELDKIRKDILQGDTIFTERVALLLSYGNNDTVYLFPSADATLYHPTKVRFSEFKGIKKGEETNEVRISLYSPFPVDTYRVEIVDDGGNVVREIVAGEGVPPKSVKWDWLDKNGNIITPDRKYICRLSVKDSKGRSKTLYSDTINIFVTKREIRREHLIIVEFVFDEVTSLSDYLEARVYFLAEDIIKRISEKRLPRTITVVGHTDIIGDDARNMVLSEERALKEANYLRILLTFMNSLGSKERFFAWLSKNNVRWNVEGVGAKEPLVVKSFRDGTLSVRLIGDDLLPDGRSVNRRVVLELEEVIKNYK